MTSITNQYRIITSRAGWVDRSTRGRVEFAGPDGLPFLQGLLTNDVAGLGVGQGAYAAWLTPLGRMTADIVLLRRADRLLGLVGDGLGAALAGRFDQIIFAEQVTVTDVSAATADTMVTGAEATVVVAAVAGIEVPVLEQLSELAHVETAVGLVVRTGESPFPTFHIIGPADGRAALVARLEDAGSVRLDEDLATALRIEVGRGEWGRDLGDDVIPLEAGLLGRAISTEKGCYVGQEIVIRILHRGGGRVAKRLVTLAFDPGVTDVPPRKAALEIDGTSVGHVTSAAWSPGRDGVVALAYLQRDAGEVGRRVTVAGSGAAGVVTGLAQ